MGNLYHRPVPHDRPALDKFACYELCVQSARHVAGFLHGAHGARPVVLREDFCGTAGVSRRWVMDARKRGERASAVCVDNDAPTLDRARRLAHDAGVAGAMAFVECDATAAPSPDDPSPGAPGNPAPDAIFVGNFSIGYIHQRSRLVAYLRACKWRLDLGNAGFGGGIFVCDAYGGAGAFRLGAIERRHPSHGREVIRYHWEHEAADPRTGMVRNAISFRVELDGDVIAELPRAFVYDWRLWSLAELRDAMLEAGFARVDVHREVNLAPGKAPEPVGDPRELGEDWTVLVVAR